MVDGNLAMANVLELDQEPVEESKTLTSEKSVFDELKFNSVVTRPIKYAQPKRHHNDPCSCGSGKKFKQCCEPKLSDGKRRRYYASKKQ